MTIRLVLPPAAGQLIYCPYHKAWEVFIGEDPALCDYCCQPVPCPMHDLDEGEFEAFDPFIGERDSPSESYRKRKGDYIDISSLHIP